MIKAEKNSSLRDSAFTDKKNAYAIGTYSENEIAKSNHWKIEKIEERDEQLITFLEARWKLDQNFQDKYPYPKNFNGEEPITDEISDEESNE